MPKFTKQVIEEINDYGNSIKKLKTFAEGVRTNIGMYISSRGNTGWLGCIREIVSNGLDQYLKPTSPCNCLTVQYDEITKWCEVYDNGLGIPYELARDIFTHEHVSSNYDKKDGEYSSGKHGVGAKVTNALSSEFIVESYILGQARRFIFNDGVLVKEEEIKEPQIYQGTIVRFRPNETDDRNHIGPVTLKVSDVRNYVADIIPLTPIGSQITFTGIDINGAKQEIIKNEDGLLYYLIGACPSPLSIKPIVFGADTGKMKADIMFTYDVGEDSVRENIISFGNYSPMPQLGTHVTGFLDGVTRWLANYMNKVYLAANKRNKLVVLPSDIKVGLTAVVTCCSLYPVFKGQAKEAISNAELKPFVKDLTTSALETWSKQNPGDLNKLCAYIKDMAQARLNASKEKVKITGKYSTSIFGGTLPSKYLKPTGTEDLELVIVEGDSALGPTRNSRDKTKQGIFPIRGKMPNPIETTRAKYLGNSEVQAIINIIGGGVYPHFDITKVKFKRIIIAADADYDGYHIRTLVLKLFLFYMPELLEDGRIYAAVPPLYGLLNNKNEVKKYFIDKLDYTNYLINHFSKTNTICDIYNKPLSSSDIVNMMYKNDEYVEDMNVLCDRYAVNPLLLEMIMCKLIEYHGDKNLFNKLKKDITKEFRFMDAYQQDGITIIDGVIDSQSNTIILNNQFFLDIKNMVDEIKNTDMNFIFNGKVCRLYEIMSTYEESSKALGNVRRYKGLGEMKQNELGESTLRPDGQRQLIKYTIDDAKKMMQQVRSIESDRKKLLEDKSYKISKEDLLG